MKALLKTCLLFVAFGYFIPAMANFQGINDQLLRCRKDPKFYVESTRMHFSDEGIFLKTDSDHLLPISQISHDAIGYFSLSSFFRTSYYEATCNYCGVLYQNESPQPCRNCDQSEGFTLVYLESEDYWDRY